MTLTEMAAVDKSGADVALSTVRSSSQPESQAVASTGVGDVLAGWRLAFLTIGCVRLLKALDICCVG